MSGVLLQTFRHDSGMTSKVFRYSFAGKSVRKFMFWGDFFSEKASFLLCNLLKKKRLSPDNHNLNC
jgi:hypothetical protein